MIGEQDRFTQVRTAAGEVGWVGKQYLSPEKPDKFLAEELKRKVSKLEKGGQIEKKNYRLDTDIARDRFQREINTFERIARGRLVRGGRERLKFIQEHRQGPCGS